MDGRTVCWDLLWMLVVFIITVEDAGEGALVPSKIVLSFGVEHPRVIFFEPVDRPPPRPEGGKEAFFVSKAVLSTSMAVPKALSS
jgi:hypothetical protein